MVRTKKPPNPVKDWMVFVGYDYIPVMRGARGQKSVAP